MIFRLTIALLLLLPAGSAFAEDSAFNMDWQPPAFSIAESGDLNFNYPADLKAPTIVLFWATWCPYCKALMPHLQSILEEYGDQVNLLALNVWDDEDPVAFLDEYGYEFRLLPEADEVADAWGVKGTPGLFLVDASGRVMFSRKAIADEEYPQHRFDGKELKRYQQAARVAPFWAARLRQALDQLVD